MTRAQNLEHAADRVVVRTVQSPAPAPLVSVLMPTYNGERFLLAAIESILGQTFRDFELIIVDDGSTDSTPAILREVTDDRVRVLTNERNLGIAAATNRALAAARGEFVALQDHDDISLPHRLQTEVEYLRAHREVAVVGSAATLIDDQGVPYGEFPLPCEEIDIKWRLLFFGDALHYTSLLVRRTVLAEAGGYIEGPEYRYAEAFDPFSRIAMWHQIATLPEMLVLWRRHQGATSIQHQQKQGRSNDAISFRNLCLLDEMRNGRGARGPILFQNDERSALYDGFKAFTSTAAGEFPTVPGQQVVAGLKFFLDVRKVFYKQHTFSPFAVSRHKRPLDWTWGKHAIALALRAPWGWRTRLGSFLLGLKCLASWAATLPVSALGIVTGRGRTPEITIPTIRRYDQPAASGDKRPAWKRAIKNSRLVRWMVRAAVIPTVRWLLRYGPGLVPKKRLWSVVLQHHLGLEPPQWNFRAKTCFGSSFEGNTRDVIGKYIYYFGIWEPNLTRWMESRLGPGDTFVDVGANVGYFSLLASRLLGNSGKVVAIEAMPAIFTALQRNIAINQAGNVRAINRAVWHREDTLTIYSQADNLPGQTTVMPLWAEQWHLNKQCQVEAAPLADLLKAEEARSARLIKIDVEGAEWHVLCGMKPLLASCRDDLEVVIEVTPKMLEGDGKTLQDVLELFAGFGFHPYRIENDYRVEQYLNGNSTQCPMRLRNPIVEQVDLIFSRIDAEAL